MPPRTALIFPITCPAGLQLLLRRGRPAFPRFSVCSPHPAGLSYRSVSLRESSLPLVSSPSASIELPFFASHAFVNILERELATISTALLDQMCNLFHLLSLNPFLLSSLTTYFLFLTFTTGNGSQAKTAVLVNAISGVPSHLLWSLFPPVGVIVEKRILTK